MIFLGYLFINGPVWCLWLYCLFDFLPFQLTSGRVHAKLKENNKVLFWSRNNFVFDSCRGDGDHGGKTIFADFENIFWEGSRSQLLMPETGGVSAKGLGKLILEVEFLNL